jgi:hypothetical protein
MTDVAISIAEILKQRRMALPLVKEEIVGWQQRDAWIANLDAAVRHLREHATTKSELKQTLAGFDVQDLRKDIGRVLSLLSVVEARYERGTINIGVSGRARVGKSQLLQTISGLDENQIPTGSGLPVTAVRSRIFHSGTHERATLVLHSFDTFLADVLRPYHDELGLAGAPNTVDEFQAWSYPENVAGLPASLAEKHSSVTILRRLRDIQDALWSFKDDLTGGERIVDLVELRQFVAYPTNADINVEKCPRRYLAVRDVRIECSFPQAQVDNIGFIDLPGLGELAPKSEEHHLRGLKNEVDLVLLVKRPVQGLAYWGVEDGKTTDLLDIARGSIKHRGDFVFIVINNDNIDRELMDSLRGDIRRQVNDGVDGKYFRVLEADAMNEKSVYQGILTPVLQHLMGRLPVMDREVLEGGRSDGVALIARIKTSLSDLDSSLTQVIRAGVSAAQYVDEETVKLRQNIAGTLAELVGRLQKDARSGDEDKNYLTAVDSAYEGIREWIESGFGSGSRENWVSDALREMRVKRNSSPVAVDELNQIRVEISKRYCSLDNFFSAHVDQLWADVASVFAKHLGGLLDGKHGAEALQTLAALLLEASEPCPALSEAIVDLLALRVDYRSQLHPKVRKELDPLNLQLFDPESGEEKVQIVVPVNESGAEELFSFITELAKKVAYETKKTLVLEAQTPALILHAAAEQFEDTLIRSGDSLREFKRMTRSYRDEIWPGVFKGIDENNARFAKVSKAIRTIRENLNGLGQGNT